MPPHRCVCLARRVNAVSGDFFVDALPPADVITMGMSLHDWNWRAPKPRVAPRKNLAEG